MSNRYYIPFACYTMILIGLDHFVAEVQASNPPTKQELLDLLVAKDSRFDNLSIAYSRIFLIHRNRIDDFIAGKGPQPVFDENLDYDAEAIAKVTLTVKGSETTFDQEFETDSEGAVLPKPQHVKWSNASGVEQDLVNAADDAWILHTFTRPLEPHGLLQESRMEVELCSGIGYGKRIVEIESVDLNGDTTVVKCTMKLFSRDVTQAELVIDKSDLVRKARLNIDSAGSVQIFEIETSGVIGGRAGCELASKGRLTRTSVRSPSKVINRVTERMLIEIDKVTTNLSNQDYERLSTINSKGVTHRVEMSQQNLQDKLKESKRLPR